MSMMSEFLNPVPGGWVRRKGRCEYGRVQKVVHGSTGIDLVVEWQPDRQVRRVPLSDIQCGLQLGMTVQDVPHSRVRRTLGEGEIVELRKLGNREQALVDFPEVGACVSGFRTRT